MKIAVKIIPWDEYDRLIEEAKTSIVSPFYEIFAEYQLVAIEFPDELFKVIKYPKVKDVANEEVDERLNVLLTKDELQQFIFLHGI
jgi:hypothetical protein